MAVCLDVGRRIGIRWRAKSDGASPAFGGVESAVFSLFGLLLAFTFSGAPARLDARRHLIAEETNAISTAYLRIDLLSPDSQPAMRQRFRDYLDSRLDVYRVMPDIEAAKAGLVKSEKLQQAIWKGAIAGASSPGAQPDAMKLNVPALNAMIDITTTRTVAASIHPPMVIYGLLFALALVTSMIGGFGMAYTTQRSWLHIGAFVLMAVLTVYTVIEIEYPRLGLLPAESSYDQVLVDLRHNMD
ncbi:MAG TPA: hypothetical protein PLL77_10950 [Pyrinomonadaceae bacterium]|nr:hypothetical protein [Pyrinomonadaceae bacterium]